MINGDYLLVNEYSGGFILIFRFMYFDIFVHNLNIEIFLCCIFWYIV